MQVYVLNAPLRAEGEFHGVCVRGIGITTNGDGQFAAPGDRNNTWPHGLEPRATTQFFHDGIGPVNECRMTPTDARAMHMSLLVSHSHFHDLSGESWL